MAPRNQSIRAPDNQGTRKPEHAKTRKQDFLFYFAKLFYNKKAWEQSFWAQSSFPPTNGKHQSSGAPEHQSTRRQDAPEWGRRGDGRQLPQIWGSECHDYYVLGPSCSLWLVLRSLFEVDLAVRHESLPEVSWLQIKCWYFKHCWDRGKTLPNWPNSNYRYIVIYKYD